MLLTMSSVLILHDKLSVPVDMCVHTFLKSLGKNLFVYYAICISAAQYLV